MAANRSKILEDVRGGLSQAETARRNRVSREYVRQVCKAAGITGLTDAGRQRLARATWSPEADDVLRRLYPTTHARTLAEMLGETECAVIGRAHRLGLSKLKRVDVVNVIVEELAKL